MEDMTEHDQQPAEVVPSEEALTHEPIQLAVGTEKPKAQHADDIALMQCILCMIAVLLFFGLHWLKPDWQMLFLKQYMEHRDEPTLAWIDWLMQSVQDWLKR